MTILVVEDEVRIASFVRKGLHIQGYETVGTGVGALARLAIGGIDLIILDLGLPDLDGIEVLQKIRGDGSLVPVIVLTARQDAEEQIRQLKLSINCYITKPFSFDQLTECVRNGIINGDAA